MSSTLITTRREYPTYVNWKSHPSKEDRENADYVLIWHDPGDNKDKDMEKYKGRYDLVHTSRRVKLLALKDDESGE